MRKNRGFKPGNPKIMYYGTETISVLEPKLWIILPDEYKNSTSLKEFKTQIKNWVSLNCHAVYARHTFKMLALFKSLYL